MQASSKLEAMTQDAMQKIKRAWMFLAATMIPFVVIGIIVAVRLTRAITSPIITLVNAMWMIASGNRGSTIDYKDKTEFGELASHFNATSTSLKHGYAKLGGVRSASASGLSWRRSPPRPSLRLLSSTASRPLLHHRPRHGSCGRTSVRSVKNR